MRKDDDGKKILSFYLDEELVKRFRAVANGMGFATEKVLEILICEWLERIQNTKMEMHLKIMSHEMSTRRLKRDSSA
jgi:hypothetical protein